MEYKKKLSGNLLLLATAMIWGFAFTAQKVAGDLLATFVINCIRFFIGGLFLIPALYLLDRVRKNGRILFSRSNPHFIDLTKTELLSGIVCGVVLLAATSFQQYGLVLASSGKASFMTALYMVFVPFFGLLRKKIASPNVWASVAIAVGGAYLLTSGGTGGFSLSSDDLLLILSAMTFALHITVIDIFAGKVDGVRMSMVQFLTAGVLSLPLMFFGPLPSGAVLLQALPSLLFLGIGSSGIAYTSQVVGQQLSGTPTIASLIMSLESVFGAVGGALILHETMNGYQIAGCAVILFAVIFSQLPLDVWWKRVSRRPVGQNSPAAEATAPAAPVATGSPVNVMPPAAEMETADLPEAAPEAEKTDNNDSERR